MEVVVGCPVAHRAWILDAWFDHVEVAFDRAGVDPRFVFVGDPVDASFRVIAKRAEKFELVEVLNDKGDDTRHWDPDRYQEMVDLRNKLLGAVRDIGPAYFLSVDSDILLHPDAVDQLLADLETESYDAVGGRCYMQPAGRECPSWANLSASGGLLRYDTEGFFPVQAIMALKLMRSSAYSIDYEAHRQGEDIGWSLACRRAGLELAWDGRVGSKHVMYPYLLHRLDPRVGY